MKSWKYSLFGVFLVVLLGLAGCSFSEPEPQVSADQMVKDAFSNFYNVTSGNYSVLFNGEAIGAPGTSPENVSFDFMLNGLFDGKDPATPQLTIKATGSTKIGKENKEYLDAELRLDKENLYAFLKSLPDFGNQGVDQIMNMFANKWWKIPVPAGTFEGFLTGAKDDANLTPNEKALKDLVEKTNFFKEPVYVDSKKLDGVVTYHYKAVVDKEAVKAFATSASEVDGSNIVPEDLTTLDGILAAADLPMDIWVGKDDKTLRKFAGSLSIKPENLGSLEIKFDLNFSNINGTVTVEAPVDAVLFDPSMLLGGASAPDASVPAPAAPDATSENGK